jgi:hypothetical protein
MYEAEFELEAELEDLMGVLAQSDLQSEAELFAPFDLLREQAIIWNLIARGVRDENQITDAVFSIGIEREMAGGLVPTKLSSFVNGLKYAINWFGRRFTARQTRSRRRHIALGAARSLQRQRAWLTMMSGTHNRLPTNRCRTCPALQSSN